MESTKCTNFWFNFLCRSSLQRRDVSTALISRALMCSALPVHFQEATVDHFHSRAGILLRRRWYLTKSSETFCSRISSPLMLTKVRSLWTRSKACWLEAGLRDKRIGGLCKKFCSWLPQPGDVRVTTSCTLKDGFNPRTDPSWLSSQATTVTFHEFPIRASRASRCHTVPCSPFGRQFDVKFFGKPMITSLSQMVGTLCAFPFLVTQFSSLYW